MAAEQAKERLLAHPLTQQLEAAKHQQWVEWANWIALKYQRTTSAVEGRNGYLSGIHHSSRGFSVQTLALLTLIHNFDIRRADGSTPAQGIFGHSFPNLSEWVVDHMGELPRPRQSSLAQPLNPLPRLTVPA